MIKLIVVGKIKEKALESLIQDYIKRIQPFSKILVEEIKDEPNYEDDAKNLQSLMKESQLILSKITKDDQVILLELRGKLIDSIELSGHMDKAMTYGSKNIVFVIGGSLGVHEDVRQAVAPLPAWNGKHHLSFVYGGRAAGGHDCGLPPDGQTLPSSDTPDF